MPLKSDQIISPMITHSLTLDELINREKNLIAVFDQETKNLITIC